MSAPNAPKDVYLHVGLPKTGTTSLQMALVSAQHDLRSHGVLVPGERHIQQRRAIYDLLGRRIEGDDEPVAGAFNALVQEIQAFDGPTAVVSEELLGLARPRAVRRLSRALAGHRLHVVLGIRDVGRTLVSAWQQEVVRGSTVTWADYVRAVQDPGEGVRAGVAFWLRHDPLRVLDVWQEAVPRERMHLVTVPPSGTPHSVLLERFCRVLGLPEGALSHAQQPLNRSLGVVGLEVVRRLNLDLAGEMPQRQYIHVVEEGLRPALAEYDDRPLRLPDDLLPWATEQAEAMVTKLRDGGYRVEGSLDELLPRADGSSPRRLDDVDESELLLATQRALTGVAQAHGALFRRFRRRVAKQGEEPGSVEQLSSAARAVGFRARVAALERADRSQLLGWAARQYLRRTTRGR